MHIAPGGPFNMEKGIPPEIKANIERVFHLDEPVMEAVFALSWKSAATVILAHAI